MWTIKTKSKGPHNLLAVTRGLRDCAVDMCKSVLRLQLLHVTVHCCREGHRGNAMYSCQRPPTVQEGWYQ
jgi:hypothetical protein